MYDELIKALRNCTNPDKCCENCGLFDKCYKSTEHFSIEEQAADAIEELQAQLMYSNDAAKAIAEKVPKWTMIESRPMDEEERQYYSEHYGYELSDDEAVIYCSKLPEHDQEVLVCNKYGHIWIDRFDDDPDYGIGFETNGGMDGLVAWMPKPKPPESDGE